ncbi:hypothetical protein ARZXY2_4355 (plasmid) [Arthrobacter sp. ZXY-2]|nr:hypothetical protein ARZXY2_4355 [Arthrobacter sp. ZXY-2]
MSEAACTVSSMGGIVTAAMLADGTNVPAMLPGGGCRI